MVCVEATLQAYQSDVQITPTAPFPLDLDIEEITVTIDKRSAAYTIGDNIPTPRVVNPYTRVIDDTNTSVIRALGRRDSTHPTKDRGGIPNTRIDS